MRCSSFLVAAVSVISAFRASAEPGSLPTDVLERIVDTYAGNFYRKGEADGLSAAITLNGQVFHKSYGHRSKNDHGSANAVDEHSIFEIGSVTKIWTTALVGQAVATGGLTSRPIDLYTPLSSLSAQLPDLKPAMKPATIGDLASFTAGFPEEYNPIQSDRPCIHDWPVSEFVKAISSFVPKDYTKKPIQPTSLPAPYKYSDFSTGILGLLVTNDLDKALPADAVERWWVAIRDNIVQPLGMTDTYVFDPSAEQAPRVVRGYEQATLEPMVSAQRITGIKVVDPGTGYTTPPAIAIVQAGGSGATAKAVLVSGTVKAVTVTNPGSGYRQAPNVKVTGGGKKAKDAEAQAIILNGKLAGVQILNPGKDYGPGTALTFGPSSGSGASAVPIIANGQVIGAKATNPGSGYFADPQILVSSGTSMKNNVPAWAAAGAIKSSASDLIRLCQLYLGATEIDGQAVPPELALGARTAITPLVREDKDSDTLYSGMAWDVSTLNIVADYNLQISKDGGLSGFGSYVTLIPAVKLGVVVLCNNHNTGKKDKTSLVADSITLAIQQELKKR
jgi:CubicO group peptidase (beta-lactamase class C family)